MFNAMKYIRNFEAVGFDRSQAEAQVQFVLDALEGEAVTKEDLTSFEEKFSVRFDRIDKRFEAIDQRFELFDKRFDLFDKRFVEMELRLMTRLGFMAVSCTTIGVALLTWLIKVH